MIRNINPLQNKLRIKFIPTVTTNARFELCDEKGRLIQVLFDEKAYDGIPINEQFLVNTKNSHTLLYRFKIDQKIYTGKLQMFR